VLASAVALPAWAQAQNQPATLPAISVQGQQPVGAPDYQVPMASSPKLTQPLRDTPQTITVVPREVFEQQGATTLRDVLRTVPGITFQAGEGGGAQGENPIIRGFNAQNDIFVDGVRDQGQGTRDAFNLEQVEVIKGPASSFSGRGSTGGSINLVSKTPRLDSFVGGTLGFGTDRTKRATADLNQPFQFMDGAAFRLNVMAHDQDVAERDVIEQTRWGVAPSFAFGLNGPTRVNFGFYHLENENIPDYGLPSLTGRVADVDRSNFYGFRNLNTEETEYNSGYAEIEHDFNDWLTLRDRLSYSNQQRFAIVGVPRVTLANFFTGPVSVNLPTRDTETRLLVNQFDATAVFNTGWVKHNLVAGIEYSDEEFEFQGFAFAPGTPPFDLFNPDPDTPYGGSKTATDPREFRADNLAFYAFDTLEFGEQWQLRLGLRHDRFDSEGETTSVATGNKTRFGRRDDVTSYQVGLVYKPVQNASVYAAFGTSFNPSAEAQNVAGNTDGVEPEKNRNYEIGGKWDVFNQRLSLTGALYRVEKTNARETDPTAPAGADQVLSGERHVQGIEVGVAGRLTNEWRVFAGYTFADSEIDSSLNPAIVGNEINRTPEHTFSVWTTYDLPYGFQVGAGARYVGDYFVNDTNAGTAGLGNDGRSEDYWVFDAMIAYQLTENVELRLNFFNLDNEFYVQEYHGGGSHAVPGPGRSALLTTSFRF